MALAHDPASPTAWAKGALRRLAQAQQEPTPENYARAYAEEAGPAAPAAELGQGAAWAALVERLARNLARGGRQWTAARRRDSLQRVFDGSRSDPARLLQRLQSLLGAWEGDRPVDAAEAGALDLPAFAATEAGAWPPVLAALAGTVRAGLPLAEAPAAALADRLATLAQDLAERGAGAERVAALEGVCAQARQLFGQRQRLVDALAELCRDLGAGVTEMAEEESWNRGQGALIQGHLGAGEGGGLPSLRGVRAASAVLAEARQAQQRVRAERASARDALRQLIQGMLQELGEIGAQTGRFELATAQHVDAIARADTVTGLTEVVKSLLADARSMQAAVGQAQRRLQADHARATALEDQVQALEGELRRLSDEVATDALTQVANRRGLMQAFEQERARAERAAATAGAGDEEAALAVALIDIDNFKRLNDSLGHAAGDQALKSLAAAVRERLRPLDHVARFGGEEFVLLLPGVAIDAAQQALSRLQRSLSEALFLHEGREVFVTFSAGVTCWRPGEPLQASLERADEALYEAKRTGKNRTCVA